MSRDVPDVRDKDVSYAVIKKKQLRAWNSEDLRNTRAWTFLTCKRKSEPKKY
jgi:hypothetical protein